MNFDSGKQTIKLSSGYEMPVIGIGSWQVEEPNDVDKMIQAALNVGYKHIDTAYVYENEEFIGQSLKKWFNKGGKREDLFITTKLPEFGNRASDVETCLKLSLKRLGLQYVDMYLIHSPVSFKKDENKFAEALNEDGSFILDYDTDHIAVWKEMEVQVRAGRTRSIGLSNFNESQIKNIMNIAEIKPSNLQVEWHAYNQAKPLRNFCAKHNIAFTGYSTLGSTGTDPNEFTDKSKSLPKLLEHPTVKKIAEAHDKSTAQILLRHAIQNNIIVIPKSTNPERIKANHNIFDFQLTDEEMKQMNDLDLGEEGRLYNDMGIPKYPQCP